MVGFPTTAGWSILYSKTGGVDLMPAADAPVVARMRAAGTILLGKTNVPVLSHSGTHANDSWAGPTLNVVMPDRVPGASSAPPLHRRWRYWDLPKKRVGPSRTRRRRKTSLASSRRSDSCRMRAWCRCPAIATW
jgi:hypothetical protein